MKEIVTKVVGVVKIHEVKKFCEELIEVLKTETNFRFMNTSLLIINNDSKLNIKWIDFGSVYQIEETEDNSEGDKNVWKGLANFVCLLDEILLYT